MARNVRFVNREDIVMKKIIEFFVPTTFKIDLPPQPDSQKAKAIEFRATKSV